MKQYKYMEMGYKFIRDRKAELKREIITMTEYLMICKGYTKALTDAECITTSMEGALIDYVFEDVI